jgi:hypothetical protein
MILVRLTYFSRNRLDRLPTAMSEAVAELLRISAANNRRDDVTGCLIYDSKWFGQALEGVDTTVSRTFERILCDARHSDVSLVTMRPIAARRFAFAWLAGAAWSEDNAELFMHYGGDRRFDPQSMTADRLNDLIEAVVDHAARRAGGHHERQGAL